MNPKELLKIFADAREKIDAFGNFPVGIQEADDATRSQLWAARHEARNKIMHESRENAALVLSRYSKRELEILAAYFCESFEMASSSSKRSMDLAYMVRENQRAAQESHRNTVLLLRAEASKAKEARRKGADITHAENRAMKADAFAWFDANFKPGMSMDDAALAVSGNIVPMKFRTVRDWMTEWKKLRRASKQ